MIHKDHFKFSAIFILFFIFSHTVVAATSLSAGTYIKPLPNLSLVLDPQAMGDNYSFYVSSQIFDTLFRFDEFFSAKPHLVESYQTGDDGKTIVLNLKKNVKFHNGKSLTTDDVIFTLERFIKKNHYRYPELLFITGAKDFVSGKKDLVSGLVRSSDMSFKIVLNNPAPTLIMIFATPNLGILPANLNGKGDDFFIRPVGSGPFAVMSFEKDKELQLTANKEYFNGAPKLDGVIYKYATREQAIEGFNKGNFHDLQWYNPKPEEITIGYNVAKFPIPRTGVMIFNVRREPFSHERARRAFSLAIDKVKLSSLCFADKVPANTLVPYGLGGHNKGIEPDEYNILKAKKTLSSIYSGKPKEIKILWIEHHPCNRQFDSIVKNDLLSVGFLPTVKYITYKEFMEETEKLRDYDIVEVRLSIDYPEAISLLNFFKSNNKYNFGGFSSKRYDEILSSILTTSDKYQRYKLYEEEQKILRDKHALIPLYYDVDFVVYQKYVSGVEIPSLPYASFPMDKIRLEAN